MNLVFKDKKGNEITIKFVEPNVFAYYENEEIGRIEFDYIERDLGYGDFSETIPRLWGMDVIEEFRRAGIAIKMMELAVEYHGKNFIRPRLSAIREQDKEHYEYYTDDGLALIKECIDRKILDGDLNEDDFDE